MLTASAHGCLQCRVVGDVLYEVSDGAGGETAPPDVYEVEPVEVPEVRPKCSPVPVVDQSAEPAASPTCVLPVYFSMSTMSTASG